MSSSKRYVAIVYYMQTTPVIVGIIDRKLINLELDRKIHNKYQTMWLDMCPINICRTISIENKELQLVGRTF